MRLGASPKDAKIASSWNTVLWLIPPAVTVRTCKVCRLVLRADPVVGGEGRLPVRGYGHEAPVCAVRLEDPFHEQPVVVGASEPVEQRRHLHHHVLGEQPFERLDVGAFERCHVALDPGALLGRRRLVDQLAR